jgi:hypothetical protein
MGPLALIFALLLPCPAQLEGDSTRLPQGCAAPADGWLWTRPADADREARLAELVAVQRVLELELAQTTEALDACSDGIAVPCPAFPAPVADPWVWTTIGAGAVVGGAGVCSLAGCDLTTSLLAGILSGAASIGLAAW